MVATPSHCPPNVQAVADMLEMHRISLTLHWIILREISPKKRRPLPKLTIAEYSNARPFSVESSLELGI